MLDVTPTVPDWIGQTATAAVGALLAYTAWSWMHSPHREVVPYSRDANRPLSLVLAGQSAERETLAKSLQTLLQSPSTESSVRWRNSD